MSSVHAQYAWLGGESCSTNVRIKFANGLITEIESDVAPNANDSLITGVVMPGFVNAHSHAFHRALR